MKRIHGVRSDDADVQAIYDDLEEYKASHPSAKVRSYRLNSASLRIRIIDPDFQDSDRVSRDDLVWKYLGRLPDDVQTQITVLLLITPEEAANSFANMDFNNPIRSRL